MNDQQNKAKFRQSIDHTLSGLTGDPFLCQRVMAHARKGESKMRACWIKGFVVALIVVLCMGTAAVASGLYGGSISWKGDVVYDEQPNVYAAPTAAPQNTEIDLWQRIGNLSAELRADGKVLVIWQADENGKAHMSVSTRLTQDVQEVEVLRAIVVQAGFPWPRIPDGYELAQGTVFYACREGGEWQLTDTQDQGDGLTAEWYTLTDADALVSGYDLLLRKNGVAEQYIGVYVDMQELSDPQEAFIGFHEGEHFEVLDVPGMDDAIAVTGDTCQLNMRRVLGEPIRVRTLCTGEEPETVSCGEISIVVFSTVEDAAPLCGMFAD